MQRITATKKTNGSEKTIIIYVAGTAFDRLKFSLKVDDLESLQDYRKALLKETVGTMLDSDDYVNGAVVYLHSFANMPNEANTFVIRYGIKSANQTGENPQLQDHKQLMQFQTYEKASNAFSAEKGYGFKIRNEEDIQATAAFEFYTGLLAYMKIAGTILRMKSVTYEAKPAPDQAAVDKEVERIWLAAHPQGQESASEVIQILNDGLAISENERVPGMNAKAAMKELTIQFTAKLANPALVGGSFHEKSLLALRDKVMASEQAMDRLAANNTEALKSLTSSRGEIKEAIRQSLADKHQCDAIKDKFIIALYNAAMDIAKDVIRGSDRDIQVARFNKMFAGILNIGKHGETYTLMPIDEVLSKLAGINKEELEGKISALLNDCYNQTEVKGAFDQVCKHLSQLNEEQAYFDPELIKKPASVGDKLYAVTMRTVVGVEPYLFEFNSATTKKFAEQQASSRKHASMTSEKLESDLLGRVNEIRENMDNNVKAIQDDTAQIVKSILDNMKKFDNTMVFINTARDKLKDCNSDIQALGGKLSTVSKEPAQPDNKNASAREKEFTSILSRAALPVQNAYQEKLDRISALTATSAELTLELRKISEAANATDPLQVFTPPKQELLDGIARRIGDVRELIAAATIDIDAYIAAEEAHKQLVAEILRQMMMADSRPVISQQNLPTAVPDSFSQWCIDLTTHYQEVTAGLDTYETFSRKIANIRSAVQKVEGRINQQDLAKLNLQIKAMEDGYASQSGSLKSSINLQQRNTNDLLLCQLLANCVFNLGYWQGQTTFFGQKSDVVVDGQTFSVPPEIAALHQLMTGDEYKDWQTNPEVAVNLLEAIKVEVDVTWVTVSNPAVKDFFDVMLDSRDKSASIISENVIPALADHGLPNPPKIYSEATPLPVAEYPVRQPFYKRHPVVTGVLIGLGIIAAAAITVGVMVAVPGGAAIVAGGVSATLAFFGGSLATAIVAASVAAAAIPVIGGLLGWMGGKIQDYRDRKAALSLANNQQPAAVAANGQSRGSSHYNILHPGLSVTSSTALQDEADDEMTQSLQVPRQAGIQENKKIYEFKTALVANLGMEFFHDFDLNPFIAESERSALAGKREGLFTTLENDKNHSLVSVIQEISRLDQGADKTEFISRIQGVVQKTAEELKVDPQILHAAIPDEFISSTLKSTLRSGGRKM